jgi:hypothetical protein
MDQIVWPSENKHPAIEICWIGPSGDSFISGCIGNCCGLDDIEKDVLRDPESIEQLFTDGIGQYLFRVDYLQPQIDGMGRVEIPGEWMLTRIAFKQFEEA